MLFATTMRSSGGRPGHASIARAPLLLHRTALCASIIRNLFPSGLNPPPEAFRVGCADSTDTCRWRLPHPSESLCIMSAKVSPTRTATKGPLNSVRNGKTAASPSPRSVGGMSTSRSFVKVAPTSAAGLSLLEQRIDRDRRVKELTKKEEDEAVGTWLFGRGGIRGYRCVFTRGRWTCSSSHSLSLAGVLS